jgi:hypothetical protein
MITPASPPGEGDRQESLLDPVAELALYPAGLNPDPLIAVQFVTGVGDGHMWHAIERARAKHENAQATGIATAVCGALARVTKYGVYDRPAVPVAYGPCPLCAWTVAIATSSTERELRLITPDGRATAALARAGAPPLLAVNICRAVLAQESSPDAENGLDHQATVQILAHATSHRPALAIPEDCAENDRTCQHRPTAADGTWRCDYPEADALCYTCSLTAGPWATGWEGDVMDECRVRAPCGALLALAARYHVALFGPGPAVTGPAG